MYNLKNLFCIIAILACNLGYGQQNFLFDLISQSSPNNGKYLLKNDGATPNYSYFYLTGDGFFKTSNFSIRDYPTPVFNLQNPQIPQAIPYVATSFELETYGTEPPKKGFRSTEHTNNPGFDLTTPMYAPNPTSLAVSWLPSQTSYNYFILKAIRPLAPRGANECLEFYYNDTKNQLHGDIEDHYLNTNWFTNRVIEPNSNFNGYNTRIKWNYGSGLITNDTGIVYIPMKSLVPVNASFKIGTKFCHETTLREQTFQVSGVPYDPNSIEAYEECFYDTYVSAGDFRNLQPHRIRYNVKFQNQGTGPAKDVQVVIELDKNIDPTSIKKIDSEYPCTYNVIPMMVGSLLVNRLVIRFDNINLPGIQQRNPTVTFDESQAWVNFSMCTKNGLEITGSPDTDGNVCFKHQASIYFDLQPPVLTNTAVTCVVCDYGLKRYEANLCEKTIIRSKVSNGSGSIIPNPAGDFIKISFDGHRDNAQVQIFDQTGRLVANQRYTYIDQHTLIDIKNLNIGNYSIKLSSDQESMVLRFIKQ